MTKPTENGPLGANVRHLRELAGVKVPDIARALGTDNVMTLYQLEKRNSMRSELAPQLASYFGIDLEILLTKDLQGLTLEQIISLNTENKDKKGKRTKRKALTMPAERDLVSGQRIQRLLSLFIRSTDEGQTAILDAAELAPKVSDDASAPDEPD